jgi:hypothetical protein
MYMYRSNVWKFEFKILFQEKVGKHFGSCMKRNNIAGYYLFQVLCVCVCVRACFPFINMPLKYTIVCGSVITNYKNIPYGPDWFCLAVWGVIFTEIPYLPKCETTYFPQFIWKLGDRLVIVHSVQDFIFR